MWGRRRILPKDFDALSHAERVAVLERLSDRDFKRVAQQTQRNDRRVMDELDGAVARLESTLRRSAPSLRSEIAALQSIRASIRLYQDRFLSRPIDRHMPPDEDARLSQAVQEHRDAILSDVRAVTAALEQQALAPQRSPQWNRDLEFVATALAVFIGGRALDRLGDNG